MRVPESLAGLAVPIDELVLFGGNPRRGNVEVIAESLRVNGQYRPVVVRRESREVLAGNHTVLAARSLGWTEIAATWVDCDDETAARIVLVDNRANDLAGYDDVALADLLGSLPDLEGTGWDDVAFAELLGEDEPAGLTDVDDVAPLPVEPVSRLGDVWELGTSVLLVGDSTDTVAVAAALQGRVADCVWTDPPYGVNYVGGTSEALTILNDRPEDLPEMLVGAFRTAVELSRPGAAVYVAYAESEVLTFHLALAEAGVRVRQHLVWVKSQLVMGRSDYHYRHEPLLAGEIEGEPVEGLRHEGVAYGFLPGGSGRLGRGGAHWFGDDAQDSVFEVAKPKRNAEHPTMKPVDLIRPMLGNSCPRRGLVLDLFAGSGSTLIAAWHERCDAALVELDPRYADAICRRWQEHTGIVPVRRATGERVDFSA